jgi:hypothetical protein
MLVEVTEKWLNLKLDAFESGVLLGYLHRYPQDSHIRDSLRTVIQQLIEHQKQMQQASGVEVTKLPSGLIQLSDKNGNTVVRQPYEWENY